MTRLQLSPAARRYRPYLFAYDVSDRRRARRALRCLQAWRADGQRSVHEVNLVPYQARELAVELLEYLDRGSDRLLLCRLSKRGKSHMYWACLPKRSSPLIAGSVPMPVPADVSSGWYLLAYDVFDPGRLARVRKRCAPNCLYLQQSVYLYHGSGQKLRHLVTEIQSETRRDVDDVRIYPIEDPQDLWFLSGPLPPLAGANGEGDKVTLWQRFRRWLGRH